MSRYQTFAYGEKIWVLGELPSGGTVTITLYDLETGNSVSLTSIGCAEIGTTGIYRWSSENIQTQPTTMKQYLYIMSDTVNRFVGKLIIGGYPDEMELLRTDFDAAMVDIILQTKFDFNEHEMTKISDTEYRVKLFNDNGTDIIAEWKIEKISDMIQRRTLL